MKTITIEERKIVSLLCPVEKRTLTNKIQVGDFVLVSLEKGQHEEHDNKLARIKKVVFEETKHGLEFWYLIEGTDFQFFQDELKVIDKNLATIELKKLKSELEKIEQRKNTIFQAVEFLNNKKGEAENENN